MTDYWISTDKEKPRDSPVLVAFWKQFFGSWGLEIRIGFFDDPEDYHDKSQGDGWCFWEDEKPIRFPYAWSPIPAVPKIPNPPEDTGRWEGKNPPISRLSDMDPKTNN